MGFQEIQEAETSRQRAEHWLGRLARREPRLFAHWELLGLLPTAG